ncbi:hypothetical protein [Arthrobacter sp. C152]
MGRETAVPAGHLTGLPPVYVEVPDKSGLLGSGSSRLLNTGLTEAEALAAAEPAPGLYATKAEKRRSNILGVTWILACMTVGVLIKVYGDAANGGYPGDAGWTLPVLAVLIPFAVVFSFYPVWRNRQHRKRHKAWLARFIERWPLRERLVDVDAIPDVWQRGSTRTMADTLAADRETMMGQGNAGEDAARVLVEALAAVETWARAPWSDPALCRAAQQAVDRFSAPAERRRTDAPPAPPSNLP